MVLEELRGSRLTRACEPAQANDHHVLVLVLEIVCYDLLCRRDGFGAIYLFDQLHQIHVIDLAAHEAEYEIVSRGDVIMSDT